MRRGTQQDWSAHSVFSGTIAYGNQNIPHGSVDEEKTQGVTPAAFVSCSSSPQGEWGATKSWVPPTYTVVNVPGADWHWLTAGALLVSGVLLFIYLFAFRRMTVWVYSLFFSRYASVMFPAHTSSFMAVAWGIFLQSRQFGSGEFLRLSFGFVFSNSKTACLSNLRISKRSYSFCLYLKLMYI